MKHLFIPYDISRQLKDKGFNEECLAFFRGNQESLTTELPAKRNKNSMFVDATSVAAPIYQQALDWFREKHNIIIGVDYFDSGKSGYLDACCGYVRTIKPFKHTDVGGLGNDYYKSLNIAIEEALKLI